MPKTVKENIRKNLKKIKSGDKQEVDSVAMPAGREKEVRSKKSEAGSQE